VNKPALIARLRTVIEGKLPTPGTGDTPLRHRKLMEIGREDLSLARLAEAHFDAVAILAEACRTPQLGALYGVWASEKPGQALQLEKRGDTFILKGSKMFCSGSRIVDRALVTAGSPPQLVDVDLHTHADAIDYDDSAWKTAAFADTGTATVTFTDLPIAPSDLVCGPGWYLDRPGFWHGACGPAACWAGGAAGLLDYARQQTRSDPHTMAHLAAMHASVWALQAYLDTAGREIDASPHDADAARIRALTVRHLIEQASTEILRRLPRAYGPYPLAMDEAISRRCQELDLYLRQSHAERDLESLGRDLFARSKAPAP
jgi:alkylation response protein AidB-like acyl-CoA dehydrogenase